VIGRIRGWNTATAQSSGRPEGNHQRVAPDPRIGFVTLTDVEVSQDLSYARVFFSTYGSEDQQKDTTKGLQAASGFIRREVAHRMQLRHTPELEFRHDPTSERAERMMKILDGLKVEDAEKSASISPAEAAQAEGHEPEPTD
jgi:ribosome-binding factor A